MNSKVLKYLLAYMVVVYSGLMIFSSNIYLKAFIILFSIYLFFRNRKRIDNKIYVILIYAAIILAFQNYFWGGSLFTSITFISLGILVPYMIFKVIGFDYPKYIVNIIYWYAIISLIFFTLSNIFPQFHNYQFDLAERLGTDYRDPTRTNGGRATQFILYTYTEVKTGIFIRNPGPFHEAGAFAVFLMYGLVFNTIISGKILNKKNVIMLLALLTTFSTAGYLSFLLFIIFFVRVSKLSSYAKVIIFVFIFSISAYLFFNLSFMENKIHDQYTNQMSASMNSNVSGRFMGMRKELMAIGQNPIFGRGLLISTISEDPDFTLGYGFLSFVARIGLLGGIVYLYYFFRNIKQYCIYYNFNTHFALIAFISLLIVLFAQWFVDTNIFMMLFISCFIFPNFGNMQKKITNNTFEANKPLTKNIYIKDVNQRN